MRILAFIAAATILLGGIASISGCSSGKNGQASLNAEDRFALGKQKFDDGDYLGAIQEFQIVTLQFQGSTVASDAQFYLAESYFQRHEYLLAAAEYETLIKRLRSSGLLPRAQYKRALCFYELSPGPSLDQQNTKKAIESFQEFIEYNPTNELVPEAEARIRELNDKLAVKMYNAAVLYMKMDDHKSAEIYFRKVLERFHDSEWADDSQIGLVQALIARKKYSEAKEEVQRFFVRYPNSSLLATAEDLLNEINSKLKQGSNTAFPGLMPSVGTVTAQARTSSPSHDR